MERRAINPMNNGFNGKRLLVMGLGRFGGGVGVTRWLARQGARVLVTDKDAPEKLAGSVAKLADLPIEFRLGEHRESDFRDADLIVANPAVPESSPYLAAARAAGRTITTEINLFLERLAAKTVIGVTGSVGKSTTTAMIGHLLSRALDNRRVWVGGNIGVSLLDELDAIGADDVVVLELSSFQLERTASLRWAPTIAVITNIAPNHLDWHGTLDAYAAAKLNLVRYLDRANGVTIALDDADLWRRIESACGATPRGWRFGLNGQTPQALETGLAANPRRLEWPNLKLAAPGRHNRLNAAAAMCVATALGVSADQAGAALTDFDGLPHRLQRVATRDGVTYYNDSKATTPEAAITAMEAIDAPLLVILGGFDKGIDLSPAADKAARRAKFSACIGQTGRLLMDRVRSAGGDAEYFDTLDAAVLACRRRAIVGDVVLLSPACASWGMFEDYRARGDSFTRLVTHDT